MIELRITEILKELGLASNEVKQRFNNKKLLINGEIIKNINRKIKFSGNYIELGEFLFTLDWELRLKISNLKLITDDIGLLFNNRTSLNNKTTEYLKSFYCLQYSKKDYIILFK